MRKNRYFNLGLSRILGACTFGIFAGVLNYYGSDECGNLDSSYIVMDVMAGINASILGFYGIRDICYKKYRESDKINLIVNR